jgi:carboxymethylenebutenolidase
MCFAFDARPPGPPADLLPAPIAGGAGAELLELRSSDGTRFSAAVAESADGRAPGVVILPDVRGLYRFYIELAERFAEAGHHAITIDYFGRTAGLGPRGEDFEYMPHAQQLRVPQIQHDIAAGIGALKERTGAAAVATVGFCLGGMQSFLAATSDELGLAKAVGFYGVLEGSRFDMPSPLDRTGDMRCPVLGLFGEDDQAIPVEQVRRFDSSLADAGVPHEVHIYPRAPHSFFDRRFKDHAAASEDAWRRTLGFLEAPAGWPPGRGPGQPRGLSHPP